MIEHVYRYNNYAYGYTADLHKIRVVKETSKGVWISVENRPKFILLSAHRKYAHLTKKEALESFIARKQRQIILLNAQLHSSKLSLASATRLLERFQ